jgi:hypothetical protein
MPQAVLHIGGKEVINVICGNDAASSNGGWRRVSEEIESRMEKKGHVDLQLREMTRCWLY